MDVAVVCEEFIERHARLALHDKCISVHLLALHRLNPRQTGQVDAATSPKPRIPAHRCRCMLGSAKLPSLANSSSSEMFALSTRQWEGQMPAPPLDNEVTTSCDDAARASAEARRTVWPGHALWASWPATGRPMSSGRNRVLDAGRKVRILRQSDQCSCNCLRRQAAGASPTRSRKNLEK